MTVRELVEAAKGYEWRERRALERQAWLASVLLHAWVSNAPTPQQLLGDPLPVEESEAALDKFLGAKPDTTAFDAALARQISRKAG
jgi:hypothetical protein